MIASVLAVASLVTFVAVAVSVASHSSGQLGKQSSVQLIPIAPGRQHASTRATLKRLGGGSPVTVGGATGAPMVVNFFASWCPACKRELGAMAAVARTGGVRFVGVDTDDNAPGLALSLLRRAGARYAVGIGGASLVEAYGTANLPTTAFVNGRGKIVALALGALTRHDLSRWVAELAAGKPLS